MSTMRCRPTARLLLCLALGLAPALAGCDLLTEETCGTTKPNVHVDVTYRVSTTQSGPLGFYPVQGCVLDITTTKHLCEGTTKGAISFPNSYVNQEGVYQFTVGYNLTNSDDRIHLVAAARCPGILPSDPPRLQTVEDDITYSQAAASGGTLQRSVLITFF